MLTPHDRALIKRDSDLPGLEVLLEPAAFLAELSGAGLTGLEDAHITYLRYKPRRSLLVAYRLRTQGREIHLYAKAHRADARAKLVKVREKLTEARGRGLLLEDLYTAVYRFPYDRKLEHLERWTDTRRRADLLVRRLPEYPEFHAATLEPLRYKPERRYVGQLTSEHGRKAVLKHYDRHDFERALRGAAAFYGADGVRTAPALLHSERHRSLLFAWAQGELLHTALRRPTCNSAVLKRVGAALRVLHAQKGVGLGGSAETAALFAAADAVAFLLPQLGKHVSSLAQRLAVALEDAGPQRTPLHGDFSADQVVFGQGGVTVLDFDNARLGDPATDLGTFAAQLERDALTGEVSAARVPAVLEALYEGYGALPPRTDVYTAAALLRLAPHPFRQRRPDWSDVSAAILQRAEAILLGERVGTT